MEDRQVSRDEFRQYVKEALRNLYDPACLENQPLVGLLRVRRSPGSTEGEALHELLRETIEKLKPAPSIPANSGEWIAYRLLSLHYVRCLSQQETCSELGISEATYFRYQRRALDALANILWQRYEPVGAPPEGALAPGQAVERSIQLVSAGLDELVDLGPLLAGVVELLQPLATQQEIALHTEIPPALPPVSGDPSVLRQIFVNVIAKVMEHSAGVALQIDLQEAAGKLICRLSGLNGPAAALHLDQNGFAISHRLVNLYEGQLGVEDGPRGSAIVSIVLPAAASQSVLVIDDDPSAVELYRRYAQGYPYIFSRRQTLEEVQAFVAASPPDLILLDVIMPRTDGWAILRSLKETPATAHIPVIICSVIDHPQLALALGATTVLTKPFTPADLLQALEQARAQSDSEAQVRREGHSPT